jgi:hypothetical protein
MRGMGGGASYGSNLMEGGNKKTRVTGILEMVDCRSLGKKASAWNHQSLCCCDGFGIHIL